MSKKDKIQNIVFVCTGNTCRSPMAEGLFNKTAENKGIPARATSVGLMAIPGGIAAPNSVAVMAKRGIDLKLHRARLADDEIFKEADLVLAMDNSQLQAIPQSYKEKAFLLSDYASDSDEEIFDPIGGDLQTYQACANLIEKHLINLFQCLKPKA